MDRLGEVQEFVKRTCTAAKESIVKAKEAHLNGMHIPILSGILGEHRLATEQAFPPPIPFNHPFWRFLEGRGIANKEKVAKNSVLSNNDSANSSNDREVTSASPETLNSTSSEHATAAGKVEGKHRQLNYHPHHHNHHKQWKNSEMEVQALYVADVSRLVPKVYTFGYDRRHWNEYWALLNTGEVYFGLPNGEGLEFFDFDRERRQHPYRFGQYTNLSDGSISFDFEGHEVLFDLSQEAVTVAEGMVFRRVRPCDRDCYLSGTFAHASYTDMVTCATSNGVCGDASFTFQEDGRFSVHGQALQLSQLKSSSKRSSKRKQTPLPFDKAGEEEAETEDGEGKYQLSDLRLELNFDDGRNEKAFFFRFPGQEDRLLSINGINYERGDRDTPSSL